MELKNKLIKEVMTTDLITVDENMLLEEFKQIMTRRNIHHLLVANGQQELLGIISSSDMAGLKSSLFDNKIKAKHFMIEQPQSINENENLTLAKEIFLDNLFRALPVENNEGSLVGIITPYDILRIL